MSKLPIGIQSFENIRRDGYLYIDKTIFVKELVNSGKVYFLSRPRRFGKSLFVSTLEAYFRGQRELFHGLAIGEWENQRPESERWVEYPVLKFSLSGGDYQSAEGLANSLKYILNRFESENGIAHDDCLDISNQFRYCIEEAYRMTGRQVVVLVDEYDKPLLTNLGVSESQEERNRDLFKGFFSVLKDEDQYLKFIFITGVTKFSKVSIFSDLNQLKDISLLPKYSAICGITGEELLSGLSDDILELAAALNIGKDDAVSALRDKYDGYHFSAVSEGVYNPFSLLNALSDRRLGDYWFETGTPSFLVRKLMESGMPVGEFNTGIIATEDRITNYRADDNDLVPLYYQSGYLTIAGYDKVFHEYTLSFPNDEVRYGYLNSLIPMVRPEYTATNGAFSAGKMVRFLRSCQTEQFMTMLQALLASIPYHEGRAPADEQQWRNVIYAVFVVLGQYVKAEVHSSLGRSDCVVENDQYVYIFEFKQDKSAEEALKQIDEMGYAVPYASSGKKIVKIGANFSTGKRTLDEWVSAGQIRSACLHQ